MTVENLRNTCRGAIKACLEEGIPALTVQQELQAMADGMNNPDIRLHLVPSTERPPGGTKPEVDPPRAA